MPTNKTISQVSINIGLEDRVEGKGEFELIDLMPQMHLNVREAARYDGVTVETSNKNDSLWVYTGKRRYPSIWFFLWVFGPVLLLSALTPAPYFAYLSEYKHIQTLPTAICSTASVDYNPNDLYLRVRATYLDSQKVRHTAQFFYNMGYDMDVDNYLLDFFESRLSYPCYYSGAKFYETGYPGFVISYAKTNAWQVTVGLVCCWLAILLVTCLGFFVPWFLDHNKRVITKSVYEKTGEEFVEVQDWGAVDAAMKQIMYSVVYASVIPENSPNTSGKKGVKFISFTRHSATTLLSTVIFASFAFLFFAGMVVMFVFAFKEREHVFIVTLMWCILSIVAIVPSSLLFLILYTIHRHPYLNATAVVNPVTPQPGDAPETVSIFGKYYPGRKLGFLLKGTVRRA